MKEAKLFHVFAVCILVLCLLSSAVYAGDISIEDRFYHWAAHPDFGVKCFWYRPEYVGYKYSGTVDAVKDHDFYAYKSTVDGIYPPEIGNGEVLPTKIKMLNSNYQTFTTIYGFSNGLIRKVMISGDSIMLKTCKNYDNIYAADTGTNYIRIPILFTLDDSWSLNTFSDDLTTYGF